jgi:hypothetical protein
MSPSSGHELAATMGRNGHIGQIERVTFTAERDQ